MKPLFWCAIILICLFLTDTLLGSGPTAAVQARPWEVPAFAVATYSTAGRVADGRGNGIEGETVRIAVSPWKVFLPLVVRGYEGVVIPDDMLLIPAGTFQMGCDPDHNSGIPCWGNNVPLHPVYLNVYLIDKTEVTNAKYAQCVAAGSCAAPASNGSYNRTSYYNNPTYASYPVIYVSWNDANNYCAWAGRRLPSEAEWEKAARGSSDPYEYPWGDHRLSCTLANYYDDTNGDGYCAGDTSAVGSYPAGASPYGSMDMAGNVWEWVNDWYDENYYSASPASNPLGPTTGTNKVLRGGSWYSNGGSGELGVAGRFDEYPVNRYYTYGFRCADTP